MQDPASLWLFFVLVFGVIVLPGMDMAYVAGSALTAGLRGGLLALAGIVTAGLLHTAVAATGLAALVLLWPAAYNALLLAGAAYMLWVGASLLRAAFAPGSESTSLAAAEPATPRAIFRNGALSCLLNPKAYAFMLAVFPAFMARPPQPALLRTVQMGALIAGTQVVVYGTVAALAAAAHRWRGQGPRSQRWSLATVGTTLMAGAVFTLLLAWQPARAATDSARDFDFLNGHWHIQNRKLIGVLQGSQRWESFAATSHVRPLPGEVGRWVGNVGVFEGPDTFEGQTWELNWLMELTRQAGPGA